MASTFSDDLLDGHIERHKIRMSETFLAVFGVIYALWAAYMAVMLPTEYDRPWERVALGVAAWLVAAVVRFSTASAPRKLGLVYVFHLSALAHYQWLTWRAGMPSNYLTGTIVLMGATSLTFLTRRAYVGYSLFGCGIALAQALAYGAQAGLDFRQLPYPVANWLGCVATTQVALAVVVHHRERWHRLNAEVSLRNLELERKVAQQQTALAEERNRTVAQTVQMIAHDMRQPFASTISFMDFVLSTVKSEPVEKVTAKIKRQLENNLQTLDVLFQDLISLQEELKLTVAPADMVMMLQNALIQAFLAHSRADVALSFSLRHSREPDADVIAVHRVLMNIIDNALFAMHGRGRLWFETRDVEENGRTWLEIVVGNDGPAIPEELVHRIFDVFFTTKDKYGTGLGLAICRRLIEAHGGRLWLRTGAQVEFAFTLPASAQPARRVADLPAHCSELLEPPDEFSSRGLESERAGIAKALSARGIPFRVLVADDQHEVRACLAEHVRKVCPERVAVAEADTPEKVLAALEEGPLDLVFLDIAFEGAQMDGYDVLSRMRRGDTFVCVHTNCLSSTLHRKAMTLGADFVLPKPLREEDFLRVLRQSLGNEA